MAANVLPRAVHDVDIDQTNFQVTARVSPDPDIYSTICIAIPVMRGCNKDCRE